MTAWLPRGAAVAARRRAPGGGARRRSLGLMLMALLLTLALGSIAALAVAEVWSMARQREIEEELMFVGNQYRLAIERFYHAKPEARVLPSSLDDLLDDPRFPHRVQHLRRRFPDPVTGRDDWGLVRVGNTIAGVFSRSEQATIKKANFPAPYEEFEGRETYNQWRFVFAPQPARNPRPITPGAEPPNPTTGPR